MKKIKKGLRIKIPIQINLQEMSNDANTTATTATTTTDDTNTLSYARMLSTEGSDTVTTSAWGDEDDTTQIPVTVVAEQRDERRNNEYWGRRRPEERQQPRRRSREDKYGSERFHSWGDQHTKQLRLQDYCTFRHAEDGIFHVQSDFGSYEWSQRENAMVPFNGTFVQWCHFRNVLNKLDSGFDGDQWLSRISLMCGDDVLLQTPPPRWSRNRRGGGRSNRRGGSGGYRRGGGNYSSRLPPMLNQQPMLQQPPPQVRIAVRTEDFPVLSSQ